MSKDEITQQEIAAPEAASDVAEKAAGAAAAAFDIGGLIEVNYGDKNS